MGNSNESPKKRIVVVSNSNNPSTHRRPAASFVSPALIKPHQAPSLGPIHTEKGAETRSNHKKPIPDGVKRIGLVEKAFRNIKVPNSDLTLIIKEVDTQEEIRGYIADETGFEGIRPPIFSGHPYEVDPFVYVYYEKNHGNNKSNKSNFVTPITLKNMSDFRGLITVLNTQYPVSSPLFEQLCQIMGKRADCGNGISPEELFVLISARNNISVCALSLTKLVLKYYIDEGLIGETDANGILGRVFNSFAPGSSFERISFGGDEFLRYMKYLLEKFPDKRDIFYSKESEICINQQSVSDEEIITFIHDSLHDDPDRMPRLVRRLNEKILLTHPEFELFASQHQLAILEEEKQKQKEEQRRLEEEQRKREEENARIKKEQTAIIEIIKKRKIKYFTHFTNVKNINSILEHGLQALRQLNRSGISCFYSDSENSIDDAVSLSVSFPNCEMFFAKQKKIEADWCVFLLNPQEIILKRCQYHYHNAVYKDFYDKGMLDRSTDFDGMFDDRIQIDSAQNGKRLYARTYDSSCWMALNAGSDYFSDIDKFTTSPQAEVTCSDIIGPENITKCIFQNHVVESNYKSILQQANIETVVDTAWFEYGPYKKI